VQATVTLIGWLQAQTWWIKNPRFGLLRRRPIMRGISYVDIDY
jgi:hypothetical protein